MNNYMHQLIVNHCNLSVPCFEQYNPAVKAEFIVWHKTVLIHTAVLFIEAVTAIVVMVTQPRPRDAAETLGTPNHVG